MLKVHVHINFSCGANVRRACFDFMARAPEDVLRSEHGVHQCCQPLRWQGRQWCRRVAPSSVRTWGAANPLPLLLIAHRMRRVEECGGESPMRAR